MRRQRGSTIKPHTNCGRSLNAKFALVELLGGDILFYLGIYIYFLKLRYTSAHSAGVFSEDSGAKINSLWGRNQSLYKNLSPDKWPSCFKRDKKTPISAKRFNKSLTKTIQLDFRSLYPSAQCKKQPVLNGILLINNMQMIFTKWQKIPEFKEVNLIDI